MDTKKNICCIINIGPHYDFPIYQLMGSQLACHFYLGDHLPYPIQTFDYKQLPGFQRTLRNRFLRNFYWQSGAVGLLFKPYDYYILTGEPFCLSNWAILLLSKLTRKQVACWTHGWYGREGAVKAFVKRTFFRLFDKLLVYNEYAIRLLEQQGIAKERMACIANSLDTDRILSVRERLTASDIYTAHFGNDRPVLIYCGRIQKRKKLDQLLECVERLNGQDCRVNLAIVGADNDNTHLDELIRQKHLEEQVWFYGPCYDEQQLGELFYNATLCVSPGNVGLTAIHALSYGCPVITHGDFPYQMPEFEAIRPGVTGDFFVRDNVADLTDKVSRWLSAHAAHREQTRAAAYQEIDRKWNIHHQLEVLKQFLT